MPTEKEFESKTVTPDEWKPTIRLHALAMRVLCVASTRLEGTWSAYVDAVPGENHQEEYDQVLRFGDKLPEQVARILFPDFPQDMPYDL
jgi:hypothetical protein